MIRAVLLCPGRGSYAKGSLGSLKDLQSPRLDALDAFRSALGRPTVREMDSADKFQSRLHIRGENASILTAGATLADLDQLDPTKVEIAGVIGNSMGWYTALAVAGALPLDHAAELIERLAQLQVDNIQGGQIIYPCVDAQWRLDPELLTRVEQVVADTPDLHWSIRLGGQAVLGGSEQALKKAAETLGALERGKHTFPLKLPLHSAFHTPIMAKTAEQAWDLAADLDWRAPSVPLIDGTGKVWRPHHADPSGIRDYTLGMQLTHTFDLSATIRTALRVLAPDAIVLPGPGSNLGSAVAQTMIAEGWQGLSCQDDFIARQNANPLLIAMRWPDQRCRVVV
jgi:[acyl-carrier-protein] S-malonyltransferase